MKTIFITGGTGYIGSRLTRRLLARGHKVILLVRPGSSVNRKNFNPKGDLVTVVGDPFNPKEMLQHLPKGCVFVQLLGVPHPSPSKRDLFYKIDLESVKTSATAASQAMVSHFVYVSVAQEPTKVMQDYQQVRALGEQFILDKNLPHTFIRPWYVIGPGHWWPLLLWPVYKILELLPGTRHKARALGLVTLNQILNALVVAIEQPEQIESVLGVEAIKQVFPENR